MRIRPVRAKLFNAEGRTDGQTDMIVIIAFRNIAKEPEKYK